jgi:integrase/recombinase XerD
MATELLPRTRELIARSHFTQELTDFSAWLSAEQYALEVIHKHLLRLDCVLPRMPRNALSNACALADIEMAFDVGSGPYSRIKVFQAARRAYVRFLRAHGRLTEPCVEDPFVDLRREYDEYLSEVRGLSLSSRTHHAHTIADFLTRCVGSAQALGELTQHDVEKFVVLRGREVSRHSMQHVVAHLRAFLSYCHGRGSLPSRLDKGIDTPRTYRGELPPRALPWDIVQVLLASIDPQSKAGWRDLCILHLIAHYGLRPSEVASLRLDSIDWENAVLHVTQHKTRSGLLLPIAPPTIQILRDYLEQDRHRHGSIYPELFLRVRCPNGPVLRAGIGNIFKRRMRAAQLPDKDYSAYSLRHAFAMRLLARGVGVKTIGDLLGHRSLENTCTYLRLDVEALRDVALEVPGTCVSEGGCHEYA